MTAQDASRLPRMDAKQEALAAEVRAEMGAQNVKAAHIQRALGISSTAWGTWFVQCTRDVPISAVVGVAEYLGMTGSELLRRAEVRASSQSASTLSEHITRQLGPDAQEAVRIASSQVAKRGKRAQPNG